MSIEEADLVEYSTRKLFNHSSMNSRGVIVVICEELITNDCELGITCLRRVQCGQKQLVQVSL